MGLPGASLRESTFALAHVTARDRATPGGGITPPAPTKWPGGAQGVLNPHAEACRALPAALDGAEAVRKHAVCGGGSVPRQSVLARLWRARDGAWHARRRGGPIAVPPLVFGGSISDDAIAVLPGSGMSRAELNIPAATGSGRTESRARRTRP
jgi:hypothetical protein